MQVANVIIIQNGVVHTNYGFIASKEGIVTHGTYAGKQLSDALETVFYQECRRLNPNLPKEQLNDEEDTPEDYPCFDAGYYEWNNKCICMTWATL